MALWIKGCPRCGGDLYSDRDVMGYYRQCLQCGFTFYENRRRPTRPFPAGGTEGPEPSDTAGEVAALMSEAA